MIFYFQYLGDVIFQNDNPPREFIEQWANDGAKKAFALLFWWLYSLVYLIPWLVLFYVSVAMSKRREKSSNA